MGTSVGTVGTVHGYEDRTHVSYPCPQGTVPTFERTKTTMYPNSGGNSYATTAGNNGDQAESASTEHFSVEPLLSLFLGYIYIYIHIINIYIYIYILIIYIYIHMCVYVCKHI